MPLPTSRADEPFLVLTGGSLLVGAVGRTDLLGAENGPFAAAMLAPRRCCWPTRTR